MGIRLLRSGSEGPCEILLSADNPFCHLLVDKSAEAKPCSRCRWALATPGQIAVPLAERCGAGLIHVVAPVVKDGVQVATLEGGQVLCSRPAEKDFEAVLRRFPCWREQNDLPKLRMAYFQTPVLSRNQLEAAVHLFSIVGQSLSVELLQELATGVSRRATHVERARAFIKERLGEPITMRKVARHLNLCPAYFCRLFRRQSGRTFVSYLARARVQRAQYLLRYSSKSITEIGFGSGFQSISHFNHVFKRHTGLTPTEYRSMPVPPNPPRLPSG